ncbi:MAG: hypothetical protein ABI140_19780 [Jatrophihabitantaceae bacterium]
MNAEKFDRVMEFAPIARLNVSLDPNIELETLQDLIARIYKASGCSPCGRLSFTINAVDPELVLPAMGGLRQLPGVRNIEVAH